MKPSTSQRSFFLMILLWIMSACPSSGDLTATGSSGSSASTAGDTDGTTSGGPITTTTTTTQGTTGSVETMGDTDDPTTGGEDETTDPGTGDTGQMCQELTCADLDGFIQTPEDGGSYLFPPTCDDGLNFGELLGIQIDWWLDQDPHLLDCYTGELDDPMKVGEWLGIFIGEWSADPDQPALNCHWDYLQIFFTTQRPVYGLLEGQQGGVIAWGQENVIVAEYCFSGASADPASRLTMFHVANAPEGLPYKLSANFIKEVTLECSGGGSVSFVLQDLVEANFEADCYTADGEAGYIKLSVSLFEDGGMNQEKVGLNILHVAKDGPVLGHRFGSIDAPVWCLNEACP